MPDYKLGKIYKVENLLDKTEFYVGSTAQKTLAVRFGGHKKACEDSHKMYEHFYTRMGEVGPENFQILLIESYPCDNKDQLRSRENYWIQKLNPSLNTTNCVRSPQQEENINDETNKHKIRDHMTEYYANNKRRYLAAMKEKVPCHICNKIMSKCSLYQHKKTQHPDEPLSP